MKKIIIISISIVSLIISGCISSPQIDQARMEEIFIEDYELLRVIVDYFINSEHMSIRIRPEPEMDKGTMSVDSGLQRISISDINVIVAIETLHNQGYLTIARRDNIIRFLRFTRGRHFGSGIVYSIDGVLPNYGVNPRDPLYGSAASPTQIQHLTKLEPLSKPNWFYYEEDFREWRVRYR